MAKALRIKGTSTIVRFDERYANEDRFEVVEVQKGKVMKVEKTMVTESTMVDEVPAPKPKRTRRAKKPAALPSDHDDLTAGIGDGEENAG